MTYRFNWIGLLIGLVLLGMAWWRTSVLAQEPPVKFVLSQEENLKLENLKLKFQVIDLQIQVSRQQLQEFVRSTLKSHGDPPGWMFNTEKWTFEQQKVQK